MGAWNTVAQSDTPARWQPRMVPSGDRLQRLQAEIRWCSWAASGSDLRRSRSSRSDSISAISGEDLQVALGRSLGHQQEDQQIDGSSSGASKATDWLRRSTAASGFLRPLIRPCGMATP